LWQAVDDAGLPSNSLGLNYPPHLTLLVCSDLDMDQLRRFLPAYVAKHPPLLVNFAGLGVFGGPEPVVYLTLAWNQALLDLHAQFWSMAEPLSIDADNHYRPGVWVPHVTLNYALPQDKVGPVVDALMRAHLPQYGLLREVVLVDFQPHNARLEERFKSRLGQYL
jgi:2'-5' RNA ligase